MNGGGAGEHRYCFHRCIENDDTNNRTIQMSSVFV